MIRPGGRTCRRRTSSTEASTLSMILQRAFAAMLLSLLLCSTLGAFETEGLAHAASVSRSLPTHIGIGVAGHPDSSGIDGWMPNSGVPWDYVYQYLAGGVNTGGGWETWSANGQFVLNYAKRAD